MRKALFSSVVLALAGIGAAPVAQAGELVMLRAGEATGPIAVFTFDKDSKPQRIVLRTTQIGVAGSRLDVSIDKAKKPAYSHVFAVGECVFGDGGSKCEVVVPATNPTFAAILSQFKRGRVARVTVLDAGVMKMDQTVSLLGFTKALRG